MPATSEKQRKMMAIAAHEPRKLFKENRGVLKMSNEELRKFSHKAKSNKVSAKAKQAIHSSRKGC